MLAMHHRRDALFIVAESVSLLDAAVAVADDDADAVETWVESGHLARATSEQVAAWEKESGAKFVTAIVQPFVLAQRVEAFHLAGAGGDAQ